MRKTVRAITISTALFGGLFGVSAAADDAKVVVQRDRTGDVRTKSPTKAEEHSPRFVKQSVDLKRVRYQVDRAAPVPKIRVTYEARNVLRADVVRNQEFRTHLADEDRYSFAWFHSKDHGPVEVWQYDRGGLFEVKCPRARVKLLPGPRKNRVVQVVPVRCLVATDGAYLRSSARVLPFDPKRFVSSDNAPETGLVKLR
ncbi:hypothetical protein [Solicola gregarius]|uniref:Uncharacterized protein n=1 Tax=Solicola gregarius TaxID=2908642 RepID=A0AA46YNJ9_9ACTN|nr:hypothetical protein [Solicola gregarius]UYM06763.1 hypothetical protein L0C25_06735 [Solicola gregarius]